MTMYFIPASFAIFTHASGLYFTGLNSFANAWYSATGIFPRFMIHSPMRLIWWPLYVPAGTAYTPQWMKSPKRASRHHFMRSSLLRVRIVGAELIWDINSKKEIIQRERIKTFFI